MHVCVCIHVCVSSGPLPVYTCMCVVWSTACVYMYVCRLVHYLCICMCTCTCVSSTCNSLLVHVPSGPLVVPLVYNCAVVYSTIILCIQVLSRIAIIDVFPVYVCVCLATSGV